MIQAVDGEILSRRSGWKKMDGWTGIGAIVRGSGRRWR